MHIGGDNPSIHARSYPTMSKPIPPPPPRARTKRARNAETPASIGEKRVRASTSGFHALVLGHADHPEFDYDPEHRLSGGQTTPGGCPALLGSNFPAVTSALGMMSEKSARYKVERDAKSTEYVGRTSTQPECGPTPRKTDNQRRAGADGK
jgi:hypothetical protein